MFTEIGGVGKVHRRRGGAESVTNLILVFVLFRRGPEV